MRIVWNEQSLRWFREASEYTGYNRALAKILLRHIPERTTLCDLGCGAGLIDLELAPYFQEIICVDIARSAISALTEWAVEQNAPNVTPICADATELTGQWDTVLALFHGGGEFLTKYLPLADKRLILTTYLERKGDFGPKERKAPKRFAAAEVEGRLKAAGVRYTLEDHALEYGQPFRTCRAAEIFVRAYTQPMTQGELDAYLESALRETGREDFPYYLPKMKRFALFVISRKENETFIEKMERT